MSKMNTSQDPEYYGPTGHEKKFHKTHFGVVRTLRKSKKKSKYIWVKDGVGKFRRVNRLEWEKEENDE